MKRFETLEFLLAGVLSEYSAIRRFAESGDAKGAPVKSEELVCPSSVGRLSSVHDNRCFVQSLWKIGNLWTCKGRIRLPSTRLVRCSVPCPELMIVGRCSGWIC